MKWTQVASLFIVNTGARTAHLTHHLDSCIVILMVMKKMDSFEQPSYIIAILIVIAIVCCIDYEKGKVW